MWIFLCWSVTQIFTDLELGKSYLSQEKYHRTVSYCCPSTCSMTHVHVTKWFCRYVGVTLGKYPNNLSDPYDNDRERARVGHHFPVCPLTLRMFFTVFLPLQCSVYNSVLCVVGYYLIVCCDLWLQFTEFCFFGLQPFVTWRLVPLDFCFVAFGVCMCVVGGERGGEQAGCVCVSVCVFVCVCLCIIYVCLHVYTCHTMLTQTSLLAIHSFS